MTNEMRNTLIVDWLDKQVELTKMLEENARTEIDGMLFENINLSTIKEIHIFNKKSFDVLARILGEEPTMIKWNDNDSITYTFRYKGYSVVYMDCRGV